MNIDQLSLFRFEKMTLNLTKPLAFFDLETTGTNITSDRIIELSIVKLIPGGEKKIETHRINPTVPIPYESSLIHGIYDKDVIDKPTFKDLAHRLNQFLQGCDLAGFNILKFDIPVLVEEFFRAEVDFDISKRKMVDAQRIFHMMEPRTLSAAYKFYCGKELKDAHSAEADTLATVEVLMAQIERYKDCIMKDSKGNDYTPIQNDVAALHSLTALPTHDLAGRIAMNDKGDYVFNFGKYKNQRVVDVFSTDKTYYKWIMDGDFSRDTKDKFTKIRLSMGDFGHQR